MTVEMRKVIKIASCLAMTEANFDTFFKQNIVYDRLLIVFLQAMKAMFSNPAHQEDFATDVLENTGNNSRLIVWNDEVNTFDWVIQTLVEICKHTPEQAEQCALIIHTKGKYAVKEGIYDNLKPMCDAIIERGINATVEEK